MVCTDTESGLKNIVFLLIRYQRVQEDILASIYDLVLVRQCIKLFGRPVEVRSFRPIPWIPTFFVRTPVRLPPPPSTTALFLPPSSCHRSPPPLPHLCHRHHTSATIHPTYRNPVLRMTPFWAEIHTIAGRLQDACRAYRNFMCWLLVLRA